MSAAALIARAEAAGVRLWLGEDGSIEMEADAPPPPELLAELRARRDEIRAVLAASPARLPPAWLAAMRRRAEAGRARVESHYGVDVAVFDPAAPEPEGAPGPIASTRPDAIALATKKENANAR